MYPKGAGTGLDGMVAHEREDAVCLGLVVIDTDTIAPAMGGEVEAHDEVLFSVGRGRVGAWRAVRVHGPREVADGWIGWIGDEHVVVGPVPDGVELVLLVHLHGDHHPVGHAFGAGVVVGDIGDVGEWTIGIAANLVIEGLMIFITVEELLEGCVDLRAALGLVMTLFGEEIAIEAVT